MKLLVAAKTLVALGCLHPAHAPYVSVLPPTSYSNGNLIYSGDGSICFENPQGGVSCTGKDKSKEKTPEQAEKERVATLEQEAKAAADKLARYKEAKKQERECPLAIEQFEKAVKEAK